MRTLMKVIAGLLFGVYVADLLAKKFAGTSAVAGTGLTDVASYLMLFFAVGAFLFAIIRFDTTD